MKSSFLLLPALLFSTTAFCASAPSSGTRVSGRVAKLVAEALKAADAKPVCKDKVCNYSVTDFSSLEETDGCGGGTTGFETTFTYSDGKAYSLKYCTNGSGDGAPKDKGEKLATILGELGFSITEGWVSTVSAAKVGCDVYANGTSAECVISSVK